MNGGSHRLPFDKHCGTILVVPETKEQPPLRPFTVKRAGADDFPIWANMLSRLHTEPSEAEILREIVGLVKLPEPYVAFLAFDADGIPLGLLDARVRNYAEGSPDLHAAYIEDLWVEPHARHLGVASALLAAVEEWARDKGLRWLGSDTSPDNEASQAWHAAAGFHEVYRLVVFGKPLS